MKKILLVLSAINVFFFADAQGVLNKINAKVNQQKAFPLVNNITKSIAGTQAPSNLYSDLDGCCHNSPLLQAQLHI